MPESHAATLESASAQSPSPEGCCNPDSDRSLPPLDPAMRAQIGEIRALSRQLVREWDFLRPGKEEVGLTYAQSHALIELERGAADTVAALAEQLLLDKSSVSRTVSELERSGLIAVAPNEADRRSNRLALTAAGSERLARCHALANAQVQRALEILTEEERGAVERGLALYANALNRSRRRAKYTIRPIEPEDNGAVAALIREVMSSFGCRGAGFAYGDPEVEAMYEQYTQPRHAYLVVSRGSEVRGGGGIGPLVGAEPTICELRKMYYYEDARGLGLGSLVLQRLLDEAVQLGFSHCYLETLDTMGHANKLYRRFGFEKLDGPLGATGHFSCNTHYIKRLV